MRFVSLLLFIPWCLTAWVMSSSASVGVADGDTITLLESNR
jgi:hypothetical protein